MPSRVLSALIMLLAASTAASAHKHRRAHATLVPQERTPTADDGAKIDPATRTVLDVAPLANASPSFVEFHSARVENDLMMFKPTLVGITPAGPARNADLIAASPVKKKQMRFLVAAQGGDVLEVRRDRDRLVLFRGPQPQGAAVGIGLAMFGATTILAAHAPRPLRVLFDGPVHLGPAIFDGGGMGAGIAGRGL
jgi:hypothetical protein